MSFKCGKLVLACVFLTSWTGIGSAQDATKRSGASPTEIIRSIVQDPEIKNFVGPSENAWDFSNPNGVPGFAAMPRTDKTK
jgi:hypothetical protein